jgi:membrane associated rhomboid family serine protease
MRLTAFLVLVTLLAYLLELALGGMAACQEYGFVPARFSETRDLGPLFASLFLHDPSGLAHIGGNLAFLAVFGVVVERDLGALRFGLLYTAAGVAGGLLHVIVDPSSTTPLVGCSGAVSGVLAVAAVLRPRLLGFLLAYGGLNVWAAFSGAQDGTSFGAHLGGIAAGFVFALSLRVCGSLETEAA